MDSTLTRRRRAHVYETKALGYALSLRPKKSSTQERSLCDKPPRVAFLADELCARVVPGARIFQRGLHATALLATYILHQVLPNHHTQPLTKFAFSAFSLNA